MEPVSKKSKPTSKSLAELAHVAHGTFTLEDGTSYEGISFGAETAVSGEVVFNTGMVGYPEALTDPSYCGQILVLTYPLVGNYGVPNDERDKFGLSKFFESDKVQITALIITDYSHDHSHWTAIRGLGEFLKKYNVPALYNIDAHAYEEASCFRRLPRQGDVPWPGLCHQGPQQAQSCGRSLPHDSADVWHGPVQDPCH
jgi:hypothetical protein